MNYICTECKTKLLLAFSGQAENTSSRIYLIFVQWLVLKITEVDINIR